jgi:ketosteroid isomerase-like protein
VVKTHRTPAEVSRGFAEAINAGDLEGALACWSPAAVIVSPDGSEVRGHAALTERFRGLIGVGARLQVAVSDEVWNELGATMTVRASDGPAVTEVAGAVAYALGPAGLQILVDRLSQVA